MSKGRDEAAVLEGEKLYFGSLMQGDTRSLEKLIGTDFLMIDQFSGSDVPKDALFAVIELGQLKFQQIEEAAADRKVRFFGTTALVTGKATMRGELLGVPFSTTSRFCHVYVQEKGSWRLVSVQGTPMPNMAAPPP